MKYCYWRLKQRFLASLTQSSVASAGSGQRRGIKLLAGLGWAGLGWAGLGWAGRVKNGLYPRAIHQHQQ